MLPCCMIGKQKFPPKLFSQQTCECSPIPHLRLHQGQYLSHRLYLNHIMLLCEITSVVGTQLLIDNATFKHIFSHNARILYDKDFSQKLFHEILVERDVEVWTRIFFRCGGGLRMAPIFLFTLSKS